MKNWTDKAIRQNIEELIEESYLLTLSESEIREYLRTFIQACERVVQGAVNSHGDIRLTKVKITLLKSYLILHEKTGSHTEDTDKTNEKKICSLVRRVMQMKRSVLALLDTINPPLAGRVLESFNYNQQRPVNTTVMNAKKRSIIRDFCFFALFAVDVIVLGVVLLI